MAAPMALAPGTLGASGTTDFTGSGYAQMNVDHQQQQQRFWAPAPPQTQSWTPALAQTQSYMYVGAAAQMSTALPGVWTTGVQNTSHTLEQTGMMPYGGWVSGVSSAMTPLTICWCTPAPGNRVLQLHDATSIGFWTPAPPVGLDISGGVRWNESSNGVESLSSLPVLSVSVDGMRFPFQLLQDDLLRVFSRYGNVRRVQVMAAGDIAEITFQDFASAWAAAIDLDRKALPELEATLCVQLADSCLPTADDLLRCLTAMEGNSKHTANGGVNAARKSSKTNSSGNSSSSISCCVVCQDAPRCVVFEPCNHLVCCATCGGRAGKDVPTLHTCPMCRADILRRIEVYVS